MARRPQLSGIFTRTGETMRPDDDACGIPAMGRTVVTSVGLKETEVACLEEIASEHGIARNAVHRYAVRHFLRAYSRGEVQLDTEPPPMPQKKKLRMP